MKCYLFVYGTLLDSAIRSKILGRESELIAGTLRGFRLHTIRLDGTEYPALTEETDYQEFIDGAYFEVSDDDLQKLDAYETEAYRRKYVRLQHGTWVWVYYI
jgi:gamma-glutamylcyclotransferase (GGCT)/AIG2-like uncharacterized protein YtfP